MAQNEVAEIWGIVVGDWARARNWHNIVIYYIALSHKDWELPNARIWLAEMDIDRGLDFPI